MTRPTLRIEWILLVISAYLVTVANSAWWAALLAGRPAMAPATWLVLTATFVILTSLHFALFGAIATRWTLRPVLSLLVLAAAAASYYIRAYEIVLDPTMVQNILHTDARETADLISAAMLLHVAAIALPAVAFLAWVRIERHPWPRALGVRLGAITVALLFGTAAFLTVGRDLSAAMRNDRSMRYLATPGNLMYGIARQLGREAQIASGPRLVVAPDATRASRPASSSGAAAKPRVLVFVLGETARADHFALLGYGRPTTPRLATLDVLAFRSVTSCGTSTEVSVPCLFSPYGRAAYDESRIRRSENVLDVLARAGFAVTWIENQSGCKHVCDGEGVTTVRIDPASDPDLCHDGACLDEILVRELRRRLATVDRDSVFILHMMGNHGPAYYQRYPAAFRVFGPECATAQLRECTREQVVNSFDNAIRYTDYVLAETVRALEARAHALDVAMLYLSDHGESLGEHGLFLHGVPYAIAPREQTHVPMIAWLSPSFLAAARLDATCLPRLTIQSWSHDSVFDTLIGMLDVRTRIYRPARDILAACRQTGPYQEFLDRSTTSASRGSGAPGGASTRRKATQ